MSDVEDDMKHGELDHLDDGRWALRFERALAHPPETVWRAITEPDHLAHWFPTTIEGERTAGAALAFSFPGGQAPPFEGEMIAYEPPSLIEFRWGTDVIRLEVRAAPGGAVLTLLDTLDERGKAARDATGWHTCLDTLDGHLAGAPDARRSMDNWRDVNADYVERFGAEASTIGPPEAFE